MLDDLRNSINEAYEEELAAEERILEEKHSRVRKPFLGMTPIQRFIISVIFFLMVAIIGITLLIVTQKIMPPLS
jgi:hypothetical protein